jgi:hypothetical protein
MVLALAMEEVVVVAVVVDVPCSVKSCSKQVRVRVASRVSRFCGAQAGSRTTPIVTTVSYDDSASTTLSNE